MNDQRIDDQNQLCFIECAHARAHQLLGKIHFAAREEDLAAKAIKE